jgi:hypothetical protein
MPYNTATVDEYDNSDDVKDGNNNNNKSVWFEVLTAVTMKTIIFWHVPP